MNWSSASILGEDKELEGLQEFEVVEVEELKEFLSRRRTSNPLVAILKPFSFPLIRLKLSFSENISSVSKYAQHTQSNV